VATGSLVEYASVRRIESVRAADKIAGRLRRRFDAAQLGEPVPQVPSLGSCGFPRAGPEYGYEGLSGRLLYQSTHR